MTGDDVKDALLHLTMKLHIHTQIQIIFKESGHHLSNLGLLRALGSKRPKLVNKKIVKIMIFFQFSFNLTFKSVFACL